MARRKRRQKVDELRSLSDEDLAKELDETYRQLLTVRLQLSTRQLSNTAEASKVRRKIARIKTLQREREFVAFYEAAGAGAERQ